MAVDENDHLSNAVQGDEDALSILLERYGPLIRQQIQINPKWQGQIELDDVLQVTYLEAFLHIRESGLTSMNGFVNWLKRIAENNLRDAVRELSAAKRPQDRIPTPEGMDSYLSLFERFGNSSSTPSRTAGKREIHQIVLSAINQLPPDYATVLRLFEIEGRSGQEVAASMGRTHGGVRMLLARARDRLRETLGNSSIYFSDTA